MHRRRRPRSKPQATALAVTALMAVACGGGDKGGEREPVAAPPATTATTAGTAPPPAASEVPDAVLTDVASGEEVSLRSLVPSDRPVLFWFWAPH